MKRNALQQMWAVSLTGVTVSGLVTKFSGEPALEGLDVPVRPMLIVRKSGRINVTNFEDAVSASAAFWQDLPWMGCETASGGHIHLIRSNGIITLYVPQPERAVDDRVRMSMDSRRSCFPTSSRRATSHISAQRFQRLLNCSGRANTSI